MSPVKSSGGTVSAPARCEGYSELLDRLGLGAYRLSSDGHLLSTNASLAALMEHVSGAAAELASATGDTRNPSSECEREWTTVQGTTIRLRDVRSPVHDGTGKVVAWEGIVTPISATTTYETFERRLAEALPRGGALIWLDVPRLRDIAEMLGLRASEELVRQLLARLASAIPNGGFFAHTGGSQFAVFVPHTESGAAGSFADHLLEAVERRLLINGIEIFVNAVAGIALASFHGQTVNELTQNATAALLIARSEYRGSVVYDHATAATVRKRTKLAADLRRAISSGQLELFYQPQVDLQGEVRAFEALIRWHHPEQGLLVPGQFIDIAEETGIIVPIGAWVIEEACRRCLLWNQQRRHPIKVCVNVSALQFYFSDLAEVVRVALERTGLPSYLLELELTETVLLRDVRKCSHEFGKIRELGVTIAIDDFGAGYSCLSYLRNLPVDVVKIDRSFLSELTPGVVPPLVAAITSMAHGLGLRVVAEGIERCDQMEMLRELSVDLVQGYLIGRPRRLVDSDEV